MSLKKDSANYMDAVRVKISEEYKPPRKINMVMTYAQRLALNKQLETDNVNYEFSLENQLISAMKEWKNNRIINNEQRRIRLELLKEKEEAEIGEIVEQQAPCENVPITTVSDEITTSTASNYTYSNGLLLLPTKVSNILQPNGAKLNSTSPFNISEFEADTSSPFDNVALKSINDVEELAKVLKIDDLPTTSSYSNYHISPSLQTIPNSYNYTQPSYSHNGYATSSSFPLSSYSFNTDSNVGKKTELPDPYYELPQHLQELSKQISSMGFPLSRVARTCQAIGNDSKQVLDHLFALSELLDLGFEESKVSEALLMSDNNRDKALDKLIS